MRLSFLFLTAGLFATVNEPLRCELFSGYRNDRIHWHLQDSGEGGTLLYSEVYRDVQYWENGLLFKVIHRDLTFCLKGSYSTFGRGVLLEKDPNAPKIRLATEGWAADTSGYFGYAVNLTADRLYRVIFTPLIGYSAHFERLKPSQLHLVWNGFLFGGDIAVEPGGPLALDVGYAYHLLHNHIHTVYPGHKMKADSDGNIGQSGWVQFAYCLSRFWRIGLGGQLNYYSTRVVDADVSGLGSQKFKLRWTNVAGWGEISRQF